MAKVFQVQAKDSVMRFNAFDAVNAVQNLSLDPAFNEEYYSELGNSAYTAQSRQPTTAGSFEVTATGSIPAVLARMIYNYTNQTYKFDPATKGNVYTVTHADLEYAIFDVINLKQPGDTFSEATVVPNAQLTGFTLRVDATGTASETYNFEADLQESFYDPYHDVVSVPLTTASATTATIPAAYSAINSGTHAIMYVFKDNQKFTYSVATWSAVSTITVTGAGFATVAPFDRVMAILYKRTPGTFPTIYYPTSARFVKGDRIDIWLVNSGVSSLTDANRLLRCQSAEINVDLTRDQLSEIRRNSDRSTTYWRALNFPLQISVTVNVVENTLQQWASLQGKTLNESAASTPPDSNNIMNLVAFETQKIVIKYYTQESDTAIATVTVSDLNITGFGETQQVEGRAERAMAFTGSNLSIVGA